jgi:hypothetical protein
MQKGFDDRVILHKLVCIPPTGKESSKSSESSADKDAAETIKPTDRAVTLMARMRAERSYFAGAGDLYREAPVDVFDRLRDLYREFVQESAGKPSDANEKCFYIFSVTAWDPVYVDGILPVVDDSSRKARADEINDILRKTVDKIPKLQLGAARVGDGPGEKWPWFHAKSNVPFLQVGDLDPGTTESDKEAYKAATETWTKDGNVFRSYVQNLLLARVEKFSKDTPVYALLVAPQTPEKLEWDGTQESMVLKEENGKPTPYDIYMTADLIERLFQGPDHIAGQVAMTLRSRTSRINTLFSHTVQLIRQQNVPGFYSTDVLFDTATATALVAPRPMKLTYVADGCKYIFAPLVTALQTFLTMCETTQEALCRLPEVKWAEACKLIASALQHAVQEERAIASSTQFMDRLSMSKHDRRIQFAVRRVRELLGLEQEYRRKREDGDDGGRQALRFRVEQGPRGGRLGWS